MSAKTLVKSGDFFTPVFNEFFKPWNQIFDNAGSVFGTMLTMPAVNIVEDKDKFMIKLAVPGMKKEDFHINLEGDMLTISAELEEEKEEKEKTFTRKEYNFNSFSRSFTVPTGIKTDKIEAKYVDGVLKLVLPKSETTLKAKATQIAVQ